MTEYYFSFRKLYLVLLLITCEVLYSVITKEPEIKAIDVPWLQIQPNEVLNFNIDNENVLNTLDKRFLSFSIDSSAIYRGLNNPSLTDEGLRRRLSHLRGGYLRVGGTGANLLVFSPEGLPADNSLSYAKIIPGRFNATTFIMTAQNWHEINDFCTSVGLKLLFDLNILLRKGSVWNYSNAEQLIDYSNTYQYEIDWQLGNEPNSFRHVFGIEVPAVDLAHDFNILREILNRYPMYKNSKLVGPDGTNPSGKNRKRPIAYFSDFLSSKPEISAATWHHYYTGSDTPLDQFLNISMYDGFRDKCRIYVNIAKEKAPSKPVWITETGSACGGGAQNISDRFVASLLWIDKLGVAAREGISLVVRQSLYRGRYALFDPVTLQPNPDYWVSILYKKLVSGRVLNVSCEACSNSTALRVYGHCSKVSPKMVFYGINLASEPLGLSLPFDGTITSALLYSLTAPTLTSKVIELNGDKLFLTSTDSLPPLRPIVMTLQDPVVIPPHSIFFLEPDVVIPACL